jgi:hypothetical protein
MTLRSMRRALCWQVPSSLVGIALLMCDGPSPLRVGGPVAPLGEVWAVRRDWSNGFAVVLAFEEGAGRGQPLRTREPGPVALVVGGVDDESRSP